MADTDTNLPEMPENWGEYTRMLGDLPLRSLPTGADGRLQARLATATSRSGGRQSWSVGALAILCGAVAIVVGLEVLPGGEPPARNSSNSVAVPVDSAPKRQRRAVRVQPPPMSPLITDTVLSIDTTPPAISLPPRHPEVTTGGKPRETRGRSGHRPAP